MFKYFLKYKNYLKIQNLKNVLSVWWGTLAFIWKLTLKKKFFKIIKKIENNNNYVRSFRILFIYFIIDVISTYCFKYNMISCNWYQCCKYLTLYVFFYCICNVSFFNVIIYFFIESFEKILIETLNIIVDSLEYIYILSIIKKFLKCIIYFILLIFFIFL